MLARSLDKLERRAIERGIEKGMKRGIEKGMKRGERKSMEKILILKFGILPEKNREFLYQAKEEERDLIRERILAFSSIEQVFDGLGEENL